MSEVLSKIESVSSHPLLQNLASDNRRFIEKQAQRYALSHQDLNNMITIATDFEMWDVGILETHWNERDTDKYQGKRKKQELMNRLQDTWQRMRKELPDYRGSDAVPEKPAKIIFKSTSDEDTVLGTCPVFSEKTRCCNLLTLDAVVNCGYGCTYCSIQSFYHDDEILFRENFAEKLDQIELDPDKTYHIGTGQASDSLLWGNRNDILRDLFAFADKHKNVILELKTKSANIGYLLENDIPQNVIVTWSLNAESIVTNEELGTAPLAKRIAAAKRVADKGVIVGFHLHPIVLFKQWREEYSRLVEQLLDQFQSDQVALISLGTLTFIKPVIKQLRERKVSSKILQMPFEKAAGKSSYPVELKQEFFKCIYEKFKPWHKKVFFYLCMEHASLWEPVFGYGYPSNVEFEEAMKNAYWEKINKT